MNAYRAARGLSQLTMSQSLTNAAAWKASELAVDVPATGGAAFSHSDYGTNRTPEARLQTCGYGDAFGENIALGQASPQAVMDAWINSAGHRANLEYPAWTAIGVGAAGGSWGYGWVQDFGVSNPDPIVTPLASLAPTPSTTAPTPAVPLASPLEAPAAAQVTAAAPAAAAPGRRDHGPAPIPHATAHGAHPLGGLRPAAEAELLAQRQGAAPLRQHRSDAARPPRPSRVPRDRHGPDGHGHQAGPLARRARLAQTGSPTTRASAASRARSTRSCTSAFGSVNRPRT